MNSAFLQKRFATLGFRAFSSTHGIKSISATDFGKLVNNAEKRKTIQIVDVREPTELAVAKLPFDDVLNLPISRASAWTKEVVDGKTLDKNKPTYCICHHGSRSYSVADFLVSQAHFTNVTNVVGGIHAYSNEVDPKIPTY